MKASRKTTAQVIVRGQVESLIPLPTVLAYDTDDPYAVSLEFYTGQQMDNVWSVSRDVLAKVAFSRKVAGEVSFVVQPVFHGGLPKIVACMTPPGSDRRDHTHVMFVNRDVQLFLYDTFDLCPLGEEQVTDRLEAELEKILS